MSRQVHKLPQADADLDDIAAYLQAQSRGPDLPLRFLERAEATFQLLAKSPGLGESRRTTVPGLAGLRSYRVLKFPKYRVLYRPTADGIEVVRVLHGARDLDTLFGSDAPDAP